MLILGIESSCDETAVALCGPDGIVRNDIRSQDAAHAPYGGIVPEIASREHIAWLMPMVAKAMGETRSEIDAIAFTAGPGLAGCLVVGAAVANAAGYALNKPVIAVNHLEGHVLSPLIENAELDFPYVCLLVTGGHTQLVLARALHDYDVLGTTFDDAAGECFDKVAFRLGISYPGGHKLEMLARKGNAEAYSLPVPLAGDSGCGLSFSGLKTAVVRLVEREPQANRADVAASFQKAAVESLARKARIALRQTGVERLAVVGGVSRNEALRARLAEVVGATAGELFHCSTKLCIDNAAMIAYTGYRLLEAGVAKAADPAAEAFDVRPRWPLAGSGACSPD